MIRPRPIWLLLFALMTACLVPSAAGAHGGNTDASGCHNDYVNGGRHCHGAPDLGGGGGGGGGGGSSAPAAPSGPSDYELAQQAAAARRARKAAARRASAARQATVTRARINRLRPRLRAVRRVENARERAARRARRLADEQTRRFDDANEKAEEALTEVVGERVAALRRVRNVTREHVKETDRWKGGRAAAVGAGVTLLLFALILLAWRALVHYLVGRRRAGLTRESFARYAAAAVVGGAAAGGVALAAAGAFRSAAFAAVVLAGLLAGLAVFAALAWQAASAELRVSRWAWSLGFNGSRYFPLPSVGLTVLAALLVVAIGFSSERPAPPTVAPATQAAAEQAQRDPEAAPPKPVERLQQRAAARQRRALAADRRASRAESAARKAKRKRAALSRQASDLAAELRRLEAAAR